MNALSILAKNALCPTGAASFLVQRGWAVSQIMRKYRPKGGRLARVAVRQGLIGHMKPPFLRFVNVVEITNDNTSHRER